VAFVTRDARLRMLRIWSDIEEISIACRLERWSTSRSASSRPRCCISRFPTVTLGCSQSCSIISPISAPDGRPVLVFGVVAIPRCCRSPCARAVCRIATLEALHHAEHCRAALTLSPFLVFLALAFWTWLWDDRAFLAVPLLIISFVSSNLLPQDEGTLLADELFKGKAFPAERSRSDHGHRIPRLEIGANGATPGISRSRSRPSATISPN